MTRRELTRAVLRLYGLIIGASSTVFMVWTFLNEGFLGHGVLFYEPNIALAVSEFVIALVGLFVLFAMITFYAIRPESA